MECASISRTKPLVFKGLSTHGNHTILLDNKLDVSPSMGNIHMLSQNQHHIQAVDNDKEYTSPLKCAIDEKSNEPNHGVAHESTSPMKNPQPLT